jgi:gliding motility-associated-like protein
MNVLPRSFECAQVGQDVTVTITVSDDCGNTATCEPSVTVLDTISPALTCPEDIVITADAGVCEAEVTIPESTVSDNCGGVTVTNDFTNTSDASAVYPNGTTVVTWTVTDESGNTATCSMNVIVNTLPVTVDDFASTPENTPVDIDILSNDTDCNDALDPTTVTVTSDPQNGTVEIDPVTGEAVYSPNEDYVGTDVFTYEVCNTDGLCDQADVTISITEVLNPPFARNDINTTHINTPVDGDVSTNDIDPDGDVLTVNPEPVEGPVNGTVELNADGTYIYTPNEEFTGKNEFVYEICDASGLCDNATVTISVFDYVDENRPPVAVADNYTGKVNTPVNGQLLANDYDPDGDNIEVNVSPVSPASSGSLTINTDGTFNFVPEADFTGEITFVYEICDDGEPVLCDEARVTIDIRAVDETTNTTVSVDDAYFTKVDVPVSGDVSENDYDPEGDNQVSFLVIQYPANGTVTLNTNGTFEYTPNEGFDGNDHFAYEVCDDGEPVACDRATAYFVIEEEANQPPVAEDDVLSISDCNSVIIDVLQNDSDPDGDELTVPVLISDVNAGELTLNENGTFEYMPEPGYEGDVTFTYEICDIPESGDPLCDQAEVTITVRQPDQQLSCFIEEVFPVSEAGNDAEAEVIVTGGWGDYTYEWSDGQTTAVATGLSPGDYFVIVTDAEGCATGCEITIDEYEGEPGDPGEQQTCEFFIPEGFSPNDDAINDYFIIECMEQYPNAKIEVYTRWGVMVYEKENYGNTDLMGSTEAWWDGRSDNKMTVGKEKLPPGTYFYILHLNDGSDPITGSVFLNR